MELTLSCDYDEVASLSCALGEVCGCWHGGHVGGVCVVVGGSCIALD